MYIVVLGSGKSGSSSVVNYLKGRPDIQNIFPNEFRLIQDPGGIQDLYLSIRDGFHINRASEAIKRFKLLANRYGRSRNALPRGMGYSDCIEDYYGKIDKYIQSITAIHYNGMPSYEVTNLSFSKALFSKYSKKFARKLNRKSKFGTIYLPVNIENFLLETSNFLDQLLINGSDTGTKKVLLDQAGTFWAPKSSTRFLRKSKIIVVSRDPRDIYSEQKYKGSAYPDGDVNLFCTWYETVMQHKQSEEWADPDVLHIKFEDFIKDHEKQSEILCSHLELSQSVKSNFDPELSLKNIAKYKKILTKDEEKIICTRLKTFLYDDFS